MVHALQLVHGILDPNGLLINVHDLPVPEVIEVHSLENVYKVGWLLDRDDFADTRSAFNALARVVADGYFTLDDERNFGYNIYVDDLNELQAWLADWWSSAILPDRTIQRLKELTLYAGPSARIILSLQARMSKLRVV